MIEPNQTDISLQNGRYRVIELIGEGSYGVVWKARRQADGLIVALKLPQTRNPHKNTPYPSNIRRKIIDVQKWEIAFLQRIGPKRAKSNHILPLVDSGVFKKQPVMALLFCEANLEQVYVERCNREERKVSDRYPFDADTLLIWVEQIASALAVVHAIEDNGAKYVHRDLKFDNVLMQDSALYLSDFGTVKISSQQLTYTFAGTPDWMAPEMLLPSSFDEKGAPLYQFDGRADIYALGMLVNALLTSAFPRAQAEALNHVTLSGRPNPGADKMFGRIGGLNKKEQERLNMHIRGLFTSGATIAPGHELALPDTEFAVQAFSALIESTLARRAENRPHAGGVMEQIRQVRAYLHPQLTQLTLQAPERVTLGEPVSIQIHAVGQGLPAHGRWLQIQVDEVQVKKAIPQKRAMADRSGDIFEAALPAFNKSGQHTIKVHALVNGRAIQAPPQAVHANITPAQLWGQKQYLEALKRDPKHEWLNQLHARAAKKPAFKAKYRELLNELRRVHPDHEIINSRYWTLVNQPPQRSKWLRYAVFLLLLGLAAVGGAFLQPYLAEKTQSDPVADLADRAQTALNQNEFLKAVKLAEQILQTQPDHSLARGIIQHVLDAHIASGQDRLRQGDLDGAEKAVEKSKQLADTFAFVEVARLAALQKEIATRKDSLAREQQILDRVKSARAALVQKQWEPAQQAADEVLGFDPDQSDAQYVIQAVYDHAASRLQDDVDNGRAAPAKKGLNALRQMAAKYRFIRSSQNLDALAKQIDAKSKQNEINVLFKQFNDHIEKKNLTTPKGENAHETLQQILALDPDNQQARAGFRRIADEYYDIAVKDARRFNTNITPALDWIQTGLKVFESHEKLKNLKTELQTADRAYRYAMQAFNQDVLNQDILDEAERSAREALKSDYFKKHANALITNIDERRSELKAEAEQKRLAELKRQKEENAQKPPPSQRKIVARDGRFIAYDDDGDGKSDTVADTQSGLMWAARDNGSDINWYDAKKYCENYKGGGYTDWRMPTLNQLESLYNGNTKGYRPKCAGSADWKVYLTPLVTLTCCCPWASETKENGSRAAHFDFNDGNRNWFHPRYDYYLRALPVRVGN